MPNQTVKNGLKRSNCRKTIDKILMHILAPFLLQNFKKIISADSIVKAMIITFIYLMALFIVQNLKKVLADQNGPFVQMRIISEKLLINLVPFIHAYLHAKNVRS